MKRFLVLFSLLLGSLFFLKAEGDTSVVVEKKIEKIYSFKIDEDISPPAERKLKKALKDAENEEVDLILLNLNTFGGMLNVADNMRTLILESEIPIWVFIDNNAASAGALISIACDCIYMRPEASIGAASVVDQTGEIMPDKYQSYMRSMMRATAQAKNRDPKIAEAMVDPRTYIEGINDSNKVLTFTAEEAIANGYCEGIVLSVEEILELHNIENAEIIEQKLSWTDSLINFLVNPVVSGLLIMMIIGGIYFELQTPGIGFPLIVAILGAVLYFAPLYIEGLAANWEILLFVVGLILLAVEIFVLPGFGVAGVSGILLIIVALSFSMVPNQGFDFNYSGGTAIVKSFFVVTVSVALAFISAIWLSKKLFTTSRFGELALNSTQEKSEGYSSADLSLMSLIGREAVAHTILRPVGKIIIDNQVYDANCEIGYVEKGESVKIVKFENQQLIVRKV